MFGTFEVTKPSKTDLISSLPTVWLPWLLLWHRQNLPADSNCSVNIIWREFQQCQSFFRCLKMILVTVLKLFHYGTKTMLKNRSFQMIGLPRDYEVLTLHPLKNFPSWWQSHNVWCMVNTYCTSDCNLKGKNELLFSMFGSIYILMMGWVVLVNIFTMKSLKFLGLFPFLNRPRSKEYE